MSLIEHRSGVLQVLSEDDSDRLQDTLSDKTQDPHFAEALDSWPRWMAGQPTFARGRQRETAQLLTCLIEQHDALLNKDSSAKATAKSEPPQEEDVEYAVFKYCLVGLIQTLIERYTTLQDVSAGIQHDVALETSAATSTEENFTVSWGGHTYGINRAGERAAEQVVADLAGFASQGLSRKDQLLALAQVLKRNLPPEINRLTIPKVGSLNTVCGQPSLLREESNPSPTLFDNSKQLDPTDR
jgi:hypothetical protein